MKQIKHILTDPAGLHARPAGLLVKTASGYTSRVTVTTPTGTADGKRLLALMKLGAREGVELTITVEGTDEDAAAAALKALLKEKL